VRKGDETLPHSQCRKSRKSGALTYRIPNGLLRPVAGKIYFFICVCARARAYVYVCMRVRVRGQRGLMSCMVVINSRAVTFVTGAEVSSAQDLKYVCMRETLILLLTTVLLV
jgi:hypothetical protein